LPDRRQQAQARSRPHKGCGQCRLPPHASDELTRSARLSIAGPEPADTRSESGCAPRYRGRPGRPAARRGGGTGEQAAATRPGRRRDSSSPTLRKVHAEDGSLPSAVQGRLDGRVACQSLAWRAPHVQGLEPARIPGSRRPPRAHAPAARLMQLYELSGLRPTTSAHHTIWSRTRRGMPSSSAAASPSRRRAAGDDVEDHCPSCSRVQPRVVDGAIAADLGRGMHRSQLGACFVPPGMQSHVR